MAKLWLIYSADKNWAIGNKGDLLVRIPEDLKDRFKALTLEKTVIMGKKTLLSLPGGKGLPKRNNVVLTRNPDFVLENITVVHSLSELFSYLSNLDEDVFVIGGGEIYRQLRPYSSGAFVTKIDATFEADTSVDNLDTLPSWHIVKETEKMQSVSGVTYSYVDYVNDDVAVYGDTNGQ